MRAFAKAAALLVLATASVAPVAAAERIVQVQAQPDVRKDIGAFPKIVAPVDEAENRINKALDRLDGNVRKAARECVLDKGKPGDWERTVRTPMRGPAFLSFVIADNSFCGGAHPNSGTMAIVYDLRTGAPVDWTRLLPKHLTGKVELQQQMDGTKMVSLTSPRLFALYFEQYRKGERKNDKDCTDAVKDNAASFLPAMQVWFDAKAGGLGLRFEVAHVIAACVDEIVLPLATLRAEGVAPEVLAALQAAHDGFKEAGKR